MAWKEGVNGFPGEGRISPSRSLPIQQRRGGSTQEAPAGIANPENSPRRSWVDQGRGFGHLTPEHQGRAPAGLMHPRRPLQAMTACAQVCLQLSVSTVKRLLQIFGFALALVWVPITSHCSWESVIGGDFFKCAPVAEKGYCSDDGDSCASVESASYKTPDAAPDVSVPSFSVVLFQLPLISAPPAQQVAPTTAAPLEIPVRWQFVSRTALPPRAPSLVS